MLDIGLMVNRQPIQGEALRQPIIFWVNVRKIFVSCTSIRTSSHWNHTRITSIKTKENEHFLFKTFKLGTPFENNFLSNATRYPTEPYVYWTVHHLDSWIKRDQLDVTCFIISSFNAQHVSDVNTSIPRSLRLICWVISWVALLWFDVCWCYVVVWLGWCGVVSVCRLNSTSARIRIPYHHSQTTT